MKTPKSILLIILLACSSVLSAQETEINEDTIKNSRFRIGFDTGMNVTHFPLKTKEGFQDIVVPREIIEPVLYDYYYPGFYFSYPSLPDVYGAIIKDVKAIPSYGFEIGVLTEVRLGERFDLQLFENLCMGSTQIRYETVLLDQEGLPLDQVMLEYSSILAVSLEMPVLIKYRLPNDRYYVLGGVSPSIFLFSKKRHSDYFNVHPYESMNRFDLSGIVGMGYDFCQLKNGARLGVQVKLGWDLLNDIKGKGEQYPDSFYYFPLESVRRNQLMITFVAKSR